ncbi:MAG: CotH kinase family protein [Bacteroidetes bacterium]|nr:CotH kinase family protein [Bacteroidota bacterium]
MADIDSIKANVRNKEYVQGVFEFQLGKKQRKSLPVKIRPRGKSRRVMCDFPPLKLKFDKDSLKAEGLADFNDFKLVTHCMDDRALNENTILREYLTYKLFNLLTPYSFRANLVEISYKNTGKNFKSTKKWGILIEDPKDLAHRNGGQIVDRMGIALDSFHANQEKINSVFQYMIGNTDWSYLMARNVEFIAQPDGRIVPVPYDFDYSGVVRAPYARADASLGQKTVMDRMYIGPCRDLEDLRSMFSYFKSKKKALLDTVDDFRELDAAAREEIGLYLEDFFEIIDHEDRVANEMLRPLKKE